MKEANRRFLDEQRHHHTTLIKAFYIRHLDGHTRSEMVRIINEEFQAGYTADLWCSHCVAEMVKKLYRHYDDFLEREAALIAIKAQEDAAKVNIERLSEVLAGEPIVDTPTITTTGELPPIAATFPSHKEVDHPASTPEVVDEVAPPGPLDQPTPPPVAGNKRKRRSR